MHGCNMAVFLYERLPQLNRCFIDLAVALRRCAAGSGAGAVPPMHHAAIATAAAIGVAGDVTLDARHRGRVVHVGSISG